MTLSIDPPQIRVDGDADFSRRHIGTTPNDRQHMLAALGYETLDELVATAMPKEIRTGKTSVLPPAASEDAVAEELRTLAARNTPGTSMIGLGYYPTITPPVIRRNILESPAWYTAYTPYQPEIAQGRLEALFNFQTMVADLTGLPIANASLLDEATAVAEAVTVMRRASKSSSATVIVDRDCFPQSLAVLETRCRATGLDLRIHDLATGLPEGEFFGVVLQAPGASGRVADHASLVEAAHGRGALVAVSTDLLALTLVRPPGEWGADIVVGSTQRLGVPMGFGGPHAAFMSVRSGLERTLPGRLVGQSIDAHDRPAFRLALQTREQHIRREKATSNICTAQVLLAIVAAMYASYHGPEGLTSIARRIHAHAVTLANALEAGGINLVHDTFFDTVFASVPGKAAEIVERAAVHHLWLRLVDEDHVGISCAETSSLADLRTVLDAFALSSEIVELSDELRLPSATWRTSSFLTQEAFHLYRTETAMLRYLRRLSDRDYALDRGMIPLGSCTMKLNATTEMEAIGLAGFSQLHPFAPSWTAEGYHALITQLETWLAGLTGYAAVSIQPNAGSQGEFAGLLAIAAYHRSRGEAGRDLCLIPASAHGTNAASAVMAGLRVKVVDTRPDGTIDLDHLRALCTEHASELAAVMITYPSTHGVYEAEITELCELIHAHGGQVYVDGANLNALVGEAAPGGFGGDVSHLNLHKTFCIPHGGGGPGVGPVAVAAHLAPFLPSHPMHPEVDRRSGVGPVSAAPFGSASILPISWAYLRMMGDDGVAEATGAAVLAANYVAARLEEAFPVLYRGNGGTVAHECILDLRPLTAATGVSVDDVAKRLIDYGFHAPTVSFPVAGTLMVEPTESEDVAEIDRFCDAMLAIRAEIDQVAEGTWTIEESPLRAAPHTAQELAGEWDRSYDRMVGVYPAGISGDKYWPPISRIDQSFGDRNLVCACPPMEELAE